MSEWKPIETAPKDGSEVLMRGPYDSVCIVRWSSWEKNWVGSFQGEDAIRSEGDTWRDLHQIGAPSSALEWMPLPQETQEP